MSFQEKTSIDHVELSSETENRKQRNHRFIKSLSYLLGEANRELKELESSTKKDNHIYLETLQKLEARIATLESRKEYVIRELSIIRQPAETNIEYKKLIKQQLETIPIEQLQKYPHLRFHGTNFLLAQDILETGNISATTERGLEQKSDTTGVISVTDLEGLEVSLLDHTDFKDNFLPLGCIFVILPQDKTDAQAVSSLSMRSISLKKNNKKSDRFMYLLSSPETHDSLKIKCERNGFSSKLVIDYLEFFEMIKNGTLLK